MSANNRPVGLRFERSRAASNIKSRRSLKVVGFLILIGFLAATFYSSSSASLGSRVPGSIGDRLVARGARAQSGFAKRNRFSKSYMGGTLLAPLAPVAGEETIVVSPPATRAPGCNNPNLLCLGETVTATVSNAPLRDGFRERRIQWVAPDGTVPQLIDVVTDPQTDTYTLPTTGSFAQVGTWAVRTITNRFGAIAVTKFEVGDPTKPSTDLAISVTGPTSVSANTNVSYSVTITNNGPDAADNVTLFNPVPYNSTFVSASTAAGFTCTLPTAGDVGDISCTSPSLALNASAAFTFVFNVNSDVKNGSAVYEWAKTDTDTNEPDKSNNISDIYASSSSGGGGGGACTLDCPEDINAIANTTEGGQRGIHVSFTTNSSGDCGAVTSDPASGSFFPVGSTTVTSTSELNGGSCSFTITVEDQGTNPPTISCPANKVVDADSANCSVTVDVGTAAASGNNVTVTADRSDGKPMYTCDANGTNCTRNSTDDPFQPGVTTITWRAYSHNTPGPYASADDEEAHRTGGASCSQTITVNDVTPPVIAATDQTVSADANCQAVVPDYSNTVSDNCACSNSDTSDSCVGHPKFTVTQDPAPGTVVGQGPHTIHITANDNSSNPNAGPDGVPGTGDDGTGNITTKDITFTVNDTTPPVITCPADVLNVPTETGTCAAHVDPGTATATDNCDSTPTITATRSDGQPLTATYPRGTTTITWTATDDAGNHSSCTQKITVVDVEPPVIVLNGQTPSMWPPNHKYKSFTVTNFVTGVTDNCDSISVSSVYITKVTSDEIENGNGDGNTFNDIVIAADCKSIQLRAEREGDSNGRVYTIFFSVTDASGNVGTATAKVVVPHNSGETAVDSGPHYTVMSSCP